MIKSTSFTRKNSIFLTSLFLILLILACEEKKTEPENPEPEIAALWSNFTEHWNAMNSDSLVKIFAEDAKNIPPEFEVKTGKKEIKEFYDFLFNNHISSNYQHQIEDVSFTENTAVEYGNFQVNWVRNDSVAWIYKARSVVIWEKSSDDDWKIKSFIFNTLE